MMGDGRCRRGVTGVVGARNPRGVLGVKSEPPNSSGVAGKLPARLLGGVLGGGRSADEERGKDELEGNRGRAAMGFMGLDFVLALVLAFAPLPALPLLPPFELTPFELKSPPLSL